MRNMKVFKFFVSGCCFLLVHASQGGIRILDDHFCNSLTKTAHFLFLQKPSVF